MKKTCAICLLFILILSCVFSFVACTDPVDPVVGKYIEVRSDIDVFFEVRSNGTATRFVFTKDTSELKRRDEHSWTFDKETQIYNFIDLSPGSSGSHKRILVDGNLKFANPDYTSSGYKRIPDSEWPDYIPNN